MVIDEKNTNKLAALKNKHVSRIVDHFVKLCKPSRVTIITDSEEDREYLLELALKNGEERSLNMAGHTCHFDGMYDQGRDKEVTKVLLEGEEKLSKSINTGKRDECLKEIFGLLDGIMQGREMLVKFLCLGPVKSVFSLLAMQITDSAYVSHAEGILYRPGYDQFKELKGSKEFFHFVHSAGELDGRGNSKQADKKRIYIDLQEKRVFTVNSQYAGNSVGLKKLALRLGIHKANNEDWLTEHMFLMGVRPLKKDRLTYFAGAFPSACGKTSTAMIPGQNILGDDIIYIKRRDDGYAYGVNIEQGIFGIIQDVNPRDDPEIYKALTTPRELIFSNILVKDGEPYWLGMGRDIPKEGENYSGHWHNGKKDGQGNPILAAHKNARYTIRLSELSNADPRLHDPEGVPIHALIYGGRDSDTSVPVYQAFDYNHGVFIGATIESESTAATVGSEGVRQLNPMANLDFLTVPVGKYIENYLKFGYRLKRPLTIFATNYFLKENGKFLNDKTDKKVWLLWMEGRVHYEYGTIETPIGFIPKFEDLKDLFSETFGKEYTRDEYIRQFSIRITKFLEKFERGEKFFMMEGAMPAEFMHRFHDMRQRCLKAQEKFNKDVISPFEF